jgi:hypothetical protein
MGLITAIKQGSALVATTQQPIAIPVFPELNIPAEAVQISFCAGFLSVASAVLATDIFTIENPIAGINVRVIHIGVGATQITAGHIFIQLLKRTTLNSLGTMTVATAVPMDTQDPSVPPAAGTGTANAIVRAYTVNPTLGTQQGSVVRADRFFVPAPATASPGDTPIVLGEFGTQPIKNVVLRQNELLAVNLNGVSVIGGSFAFWVWWTEEIDRGPVYAQG